MIWGQIRKEEAKPGCKVKKEENVKESQEQVEASTNLVEYAPLPE